MPFGTGTSLEGNVVGNENGITISLEKMNKVLSVNAEDFDCRVQAWVTKEQLNELPGVECSLPGGAFYAFPKVIGTGMNGAEFARKAMHEAGVAIVPGSAFGETCQNYVRFSFAASRDNISQALENIKKMLTK